MTHPTAASPAPAPSAKTLGELRASGHELRTLREEVRGNLVAALAEGRDPWPGLHGFATTVIPQLERALLAGHDIVLLGERGQGKTRLLRSLVGLLDEWTPVIAGSELGEHPYEPVTPRPGGGPPSSATTCPIEWRHRDERYAEKLATPDTSVADLIGDVDPMKVAEGRSLGDPETIHFGLIPRSHRGIVAINELPDLAERIQVAHAQRDGGARHPDPRLRPAAPPRRAGRGHRQPRGLHQPRSHHHAAARTASAPRSAPTTRASSRTRWP